MGKLDPLLWLPADDLLIEGVNDILHLSGEEELPKRPEARLPWDGYLWFRSAPVGNWFRHVEERVNRQNSRHRQFVCTHLFVVIDEDEVGGVLPRDGGPWGGRGEATGVDDSVRVSGHGG